MRSNRTRYIKASSRHRRSSQVHRRVRLSGGITLLMALLVGLSGCKTPDFIGRRYNNFTAYYNTFYNAERQFRSGYENLDRFGAEVDREQYLPLFVKTTGTSASREFEQTVLKSADILREHPESKWVDDALMLIGKSYFYQENYVGAIQKFTEVLDQQTNLRDEAQFWLARSLMTSGAYDEALEVLTLAMAQEDADAQWVAQDRMLLAELAIRQELWSEAAGHLDAGLDEIKDKELAARASFLLGQVQETLGDYPAAYEAYRGVRNYSAPYELDYAARYSAVRIDGIYLDADRALGDVRKLERDDKNIDKTAELRFLRGRILQEVGDVDRAVTIYEELLYDPLALPPGASLGNLRGRIHYALGELYRDVDMDYVMAAAHFDTAAVSINTGGSTRTSNRPATTQNQARAPEAIQDAEQLKESFSRYAFVWRDVARYDSLLFLGTLPQEEYDARILEMRQKRAEELEEQRRLLAQRQREQAFRESAGASNLNNNRGLPEGKVIPTQDDPTGMAGGFLFHEDAIRVQEGRLQFQNVWGNRPLVPNWRRSAALSAADVQAAEEELAEQQALLEEMTQEELPEIDDSAVPRDSTDQVTMRSQRAIARYELGNILFLGMALPDSAAVWYRTVIEEDSEEAVASRAQFALAEVQRALGDSLSAVRLYRDLLDRFPSSDFIPSVQDRLGIESDMTVISDSSDMAVDAFERALAMRETGQEGVIDSLFIVASDWIEYPEASRALLAISDLHLKQADGDSAKVFMPIPYAVHTDRMAVIWPNKFKTQAELDSLAAMVDLPVDSLDLATPPVATDSLALEVDPAADMPADSSMVGVIEEGVNPGADNDAADDLLDPAATEVDVSVADSTVVQDPSDMMMDPAPSDSMQTGAPAVMDMGPVTEEVEQWIPPELSIEDVLGRIVSLDSRTSIGIRAKTTLDAIVELRTPPPPVVDSLATDSLALARVLTDSLGNVIVPDSLAAADDSTLAALGFGGEKTLESDSTNAQPAPPPAAMSDEAVMALVAQAAARQDSLRAAQERAVPVAGGPVNQEEEEEEDERVRTSTNLKPMLPNGQFDTEATGYTFTFGSHPDLVTAQAQFRELRTLLEETGIELYLISNAEGEQLEYLVGWGRFFSREERESVEAEFSSILPEPRNILHLLPAE